MFPCEELRVLGHRLLEVSGAQNVQAKFNIDETELNRVQNRITEHRLNCPICAEFNKRQELLQQRNEN